MNLAEHNHELRDVFKRTLDGFDQHFIEGTEHTAAAVALVIAKHSKTQSPCIYLTMRSAKLNKHAGQYALPGGKVDCGESITQAAIRELSEELGISVPTDNVLGRLDDFQSQSGFIISPVVLWCDGLATLKPNPQEVAKTFEIPLSELVDEDLGRFDHHNSSHELFSISPPSVGNQVYSPTAAIIFQFRELLLLNRETRVAHFKQPSFAWR